MSDNRISEKVTDGLRCRYQHRSEMDQGTMDDPDHHLDPGGLFPIGTKFEI